MALTNAPQSHSSQDKRLPLGGLSDADCDISRFQERLNAMVSELVDYPAQTPFPEFKKLPRRNRPIGTACFSIFNASEAVALAEQLRHHIPAHVQKVLGMIQPTFDHLLLLPAPTSEQERSWMVYFDGTIRWELTDSRDGRLRTGRITRRGKYVGSSVDSRGGGFRLDRHRQAALTKASSEIKQRHHEELCKDRTEANLKVLATFDLDDRKKPYVPIVETIFMAFIGTFVGRGKPGLYNPQACQDLYDGMRTRSGMPEIDGDGLNGALSVHQGVIGLSIGRQTYWCFNCGQELQPRTSQRNASRLVELGNPLGPRRCCRCDQFFAITGQERCGGPNNKFTFKDHREWVAAGNADICGNPVCTAVRSPQSGFSGYMERSRCQACGDFLRYQRKRDVPEAEIKERQLSPAEVAARQHEWTSEEDYILEAKRKEGLLFVDLVHTHFPDTTAQILRERSAFLVARRAGPEKRARVAERAKQAPAWTDEEVRVLEEGIAQGQTGRSLAPLLLQRSLTSVLTKMSWLRKRRSQLSRRNNEEEG